MAQGQSPSRRGRCTQNGQSADQQGVLVASESSHSVLNDVDLLCEAGTRRIGDAEEVEARRPPIECVDRGEGLREGRDSSGEASRVLLRSRHVRSVYPLHEQTRGAEEA